MSIVITGVCAGPLSTAPPAAAPHATSLSARALLKEIDRDGARAVVGRLWDDPERFDEVLEAIETGRPEWLEVARRLRPASDGHVSECLNMTVGQALPKDPERVLRLVGHGFELREVCGSPFDDPEPGEAEEYERRTIRALKAGGLDQVRIECIGLVRLPPPEPLAPEGTEDSSCEHAGCPRVVCRLFYAVKESLDYGLDTGQEPEKRLKDYFRVSKELLAEIDKDFVLASYTPRDDDYELIVIRRGDPNERFRATRYEKFHWSDGRWISLGSYRYF